MGARVLINGTRYYAKMETIKVADPRTTGLWLLTDLFAWS